MRKIEVCCSTPTEVIEAERAGATRVELCAAIGLGGITPSYGTIETASKATRHIDINVLIRCREGGFCYNSEEIDIMCRDIAYCRTQGIHGVVIGALTPEGDIDIPACRKMIECAGDLSVTFHRAFDICNNGEKALESIISLGCDRLLTSGMEATAEQGAAYIAQLIKQAAGRIIIMPGAGIKPNNIANIERATNATEFHSTAATDISDSAFATQKLSFAADINSDGLLRRSSYEIIKALVNN